MTNTPKDTSELYKEGITSLYCTHEWGYGLEGKVAYCTICGTQRNLYSPCPHCGQGVKELHTLMDSGGTYWVGCVRCWDRLSFNVIRKVLPKAYSNNYYQTDDLLPRK